MKTVTIWDIEARMTRLPRHARPREAANQARTLMRQLEDLKDFEVRPGDTIDRILDAYNETLARVDEVTHA
ncbi:MAG: hypothetical protein JWL76_2121 [Thermoleophilia bacterium]|nr:hypothetical protein [Thermoleophilia bacterium]